MSKDARKILTFTTKSEGEIEEIVKELRFGKVKELKTQYYPYIYFAFAYDKKKGVLRRRSVRKEGESILDSNWHRYPINDFERYFRKDLIPAYADISEESVSIESIPYTEIDDPLVFVKSVFEAVMNYVAAKEAEFSSKAAQTKESTKGLMQEAGRLARRGHVLTARIISDRVTFIRSTVDKERKRFIKQISKRFKKCLGTDSIKEILRAEVFHCPHYILISKDGDILTLDHHGREIMEF